MKVALLTCALVSVMVFAPDDDLHTTRLATCQDSWLDWKDDPAAVAKFGGAFQSAFVRKGNDGSFVPRAPLTVAGLRVTRAYPESIGMGVGFSVVLTGTFDQAKKNVEAVLGKPFKGCEQGDGMRSCELEIAEKRTAVIMAADKAGTKETLVGCYYFYAK